jgi:hypothetical protein
MPHAEVLLRVVHWQLPAGTAALLNKSALGVALVQLECWFHVADGQRTACGDSYHGAVWEP